MTNTNEKKGLSAVATIDQTRVYSFVFQLPVEQKQNGKEYTPSIAIEIPGMDPMKINAKLFYNPDRKIEYELRLRNIFTQPAQWSGESG
jgi:hypothetical protein